MKARFLSGSLFTRDYLTNAITDEPEFDTIDPLALADVLKPIFDDFPLKQSLSETKTGDDLTRKILLALGWEHSEWQVNLAPKVHNNIPDGFLFLDEQSKTTANTHMEHWKRYQHSVVLIESKRWGRPLDRGMRKKDESIAPSTQMLRYLRRANDLTNGNLRWGFLTNGAVWRLYYQGARSVSEQFLEIDLASLLHVCKEPIDTDDTDDTTDPIDIDDIDDATDPVNTGDIDDTTDPIDTDDTDDTTDPVDTGDIDDATDPVDTDDTDDTENDQLERNHWLKVFSLMFRRESFASSPTDSKTFHIRAIEKGRFREEQVARNISDVVFQTVFPALINAIAEDKPEAGPNDIRHAAMILLYRILFLFHAEDRNLLPVYDERYDDYTLRDKVRGDVRRRKDQNDTFSDLQDRYWSAIDGLSRTIDKGDASIGLPPYNGCLFDRTATPILDGIRIPDSVMAEIIDLLSYERQGDQRHYINYRDLGVQHLGSIHERLLEFEIRRNPDNGLVVRPDLFARKSSGSYYTPDDLVVLILKETLEPLIEDKLSAFREKVAALSDVNIEEDDKISQLRRVDPAEALLTLRVCDPAMGSGHFLVNLVDYLTDTIIETLAEVSSIVDQVEEPYTSPLVDRIIDIRATIRNKADDNNQSVNIEQLDDRHMIRRMVLKRCVYGVDKNQMAVELAKVSLWLHTFTMGAPLSFLDHHLRCGDALFGETVGRVLKRLNANGQEILISDALSKARSSAASMQIIEGLTDAETAEVHRSAEIFEGVVTMTDPLDRFMKLIHAIDWLGLTSQDDKVAIQAWLDGQFGDPVEIARGRIRISPPALTQEALILPQTPTQGDLMIPATPGVTRFAVILRNALALIEEERFLNWEVAFPGVWRQWDGVRTGGFDALIGNPPWDVYEFEEVPWFKCRDPIIAKIGKSERKKKIDALKEQSDPLWFELEQARTRIRQGSTLIKKNDTSYIWNTRGKLDLYKLFAEKAVQLLAPNGLVGFLVPTGIATDKATSGFFYDRAVNGRIQTILDFENRKGFFPDVHARSRFCVFVTSGDRTFPVTECSYFMHSLEDINDPDRKFHLTAEDFARVNPNTRTSPIFRRKRDAEITAQVYAAKPILSLHKGKKKKPLWPVVYSQMLNISTDEDLFKTVQQLEETEGAYSIGQNRFQNANGIWLPLYEGKMAQAFDHRASDVYINPENVFRQRQQLPVPVEEKVNPDRYPATWFYVQDTGTWWPNKDAWTIAFKDVTSTTNMRTMIATMLPRSGVAHTFPVLSLKDEVMNRAPTAAVILGCLNAIPFDYIARQKVPATHFTWYVLEQLPVIPLEDIKSTRFGDTSAWDLVTEMVLELTYTAHDMAPFARDMGHIDDKGEVLPPYQWNEIRRIRLKAKLDAVFFHLYGIFNPVNPEQSRDDIRYIYSTFPIVERQEIKAYSRYLSRDLALAYCNTLAEGYSHAEPEV